MEIDYIALFVRDVPISFIFYRDILKFEFPKGIANNSTEGKSGSIKIGIYGQEWYEKLFNRSFMPQEQRIIFAFTTKDIDSFYQGLIDRSVDIIQPPQVMPWGQRLCFFSDPDGYIWEAREQSES